MSSNELQAVDQKMFDSVKLSIDQQSLLMAVVTEELRKYECEILNGREAKVPFADHVVAKVHVEYGRCDAVGDRGHFVTLPVYDFISRDRSESEVLALLALIYQGCRAFFALKPLSFTLVH